VEVATNGNSRSHENQKKLESDQTLIFSISPRAQAYTIKKRFIFSLLPLILSDYFLILAVFYLVNPGGI
jgi:hypothetical protein